MTSTRFLGAGTIGLFLFIFCRLSLSANIVVPNVADIVANQPSDHKNPNAVFAEPTAFDDTDLPLGVSTALAALDEDTLLSVLEIATSSTEIFGEIILYLTLDWLQTGCEWLNDIAGVVEDGWNYMASGQIVEDAASVFDDVCETFNPCNWFFDLDTTDMPLSLYDELVDLYYVKKNYKLARFKYNVWRFNGIVWNDEFVSKLGFKSDAQMEAKMTAALKKMYHKHFSDVKPLDIVDCQILDPVELINPKYVSTLPIIAGFLNNAAVYEQTGISSETSGVPAITVSFAAEVCAEFIVAGCVGGGFGFAVDFEGEVILFDMLAASLGVNTPQETIGDVDANFIVSFGIYESIEAVPGNALVGSASVSTIIGGIGASIVWSADTPSLIPIGIEFACAFDLTFSEFTPSVGVSIGYVYTEELAVLTNSGCSAMAVDVDYDDMMKGINFPKIGGSLDEHFHIRGGSSGNALITVPLDYEDKENTVEYKEFGGSPMTVKGNDETVFSVSSINPNSMASFGNSYLLMSLIVLGAAFITAIGCYGKKFAKYSKDTEHQPLL